MACVGGIDKDVFKRTELVWGGAFAADCGLVSPDPKKGLSGVMMQNMGINYAQNVARIYELGEAGKTPAVYYVGGRSQGNLQVANVVGPKAAMKTFYTTFSDVCQAVDNNIVLSLQRADCSSSGQSRTVTYTAKFCVLIQIGLSVAAQDMIINQTSNLMFSNLEYEEK